MAALQAKVLRASWEGSGVVLSGKITQGPVSVLGRQVTLSLTVEQARSLAGLADAAEVYLKKLEVKTTRINEANQ